MVDVLIAVAETEDVHLAVGVQNHSVGDEPFDELARGAFLMLVLERSRDIHVEDQFGLEARRYTRLVE